MFKISDAPDKVLRYVEAISCIADKNRSAFGFLPARAYEDAALQRKLIVALKGSELVGYLLFGGSFPTARVFQTYVAPSSRSKGVGNLLISTLKTKARHEGYLRITARVATDLPDANAFYQSQGFEIARTVEGGKSTGRKIHLRAFEVDVPKLFSGTSTASSGLPTVSPNQDRCLLDLNVIIDLVKDRPDSAAALALFAGAMRQNVRLIVSTEMFKELRRNASQFQGNDTLTQLVEQFPRLSAPPGRLHKSKRDELAQALFPTRFNDRGLTERDSSDIAHLITAHHHQIPSFITGEKAILRNRSKILQLLKIHVLSAAELTDTDLATHTQETISIEKSGPLEIVDENEIGVTELKAVLETLSGDFSARNEFLNWIRENRENLRMLSARINGQVVCLAAWPQIPNNKQPNHLAVMADETQPNIRVAIDLLLNRARSDLSRRGPIVMESHPFKSQTEVRRQLVQGGWHEAQDKHLKACIGHVLLPEDWDSTMQKIEICGGPKIRSAAPTSTNSRIRLEEMDGSLTTKTLLELETMLAHVLFLFRSRAGIILPIQRAWSDGLLGTSPQGQLFGQAHPARMSQKTYFRSTLRSNLFKPGMPLCFYESGTGTGAKAVVAIGRCIDQIIVKKSDVPAMLSDAGVLDEAAIEKICNGVEVSAVTFDNVFKFPTPVRFKTLQRLGIADGSNLVTASKISGDDVMAIWKLACADE